MITSCHPYTPCVFSCFSIVWFSKANQTWS
uniref:Uncharacterized protein n=1 Tax=Anguilla anguilla TaxID=7936 RepID=A0A0E9P7F1_ANGAN